MRRAAGGADREHSHTLVVSSWDRFPAKVAAGGVVFPVRIHLPAALRAELQAAGALSTVPEAARIESPQPGRVPNRMVDSVLTRFVRHCDQFGRLTGISLEVEWFSRSSTRSGGSRQFGFEMSDVRLPHRLQIQALAKAIAVDREVPANCNRFLGRRSEQNTGAAQVETRSIEWPHQDFRDAGRLCGYELDVSVIGYSEVAASE